MSKMPNAKSTLSQDNDRLREFVRVIAGIDPRDCAVTELRGYVNSARQLLAEVARGPSAATRGGGGE